MINNKNSSVQAAGGKVDIKNAGYDGGRCLKLDDMAVSVGQFRSKPYAEQKTAGIKTRGNGAATKGVTARGPMA